MRYKKNDLEKEANTFGALSVITRTYEDVALTSMRKIREQVLLTRQFLDGVEEVYRHSKSSYLKGMSFLPKRMRESQLKQIAKNGRTVVVLISANQGLLGNLVFESYKVFSDLITKTESDPVILGGIGKYLIEADKPQVKYTFFGFEDYKILEDEVKPIVDFISTYERILVVYPNFESVLRQSPKIDDISGGVLSENEAKDPKSYFFEPSAPEVLKFFETQIIGALFKQKLLDSMLARFAARLTMMDQASQEVERLIAINRRDLVRVKKREANKELALTFAGLSIWEENGGS